MKIDLHVHIKRRSRCAQGQPEEMAMAAMKRGLDAIVLLDHHYYPTDDDVKRAKSVGNIQVFRGAELTIKDPRKRLSSDILLISDREPDFDYKNYEKRMTFEEGKAIDEFSKKTNGLTILAHPFRKDKDVFVSFIPDAIEIASKNTAFHNRKRIVNLAKKYNLRLIAASDAHNPRHLGGFCVQLNHWVDNEAELAKAIKESAYRSFEMRMAPILLPS